MRDLKFGPIGANALHICVDMQRMFREETPWRTPWMDRILPRVAAVCRHNPGRTIFTRFVPADKPGDGDGSWSRYWNKWSDMTLARLGPAMVDLAPELAALVPPAEIADKRVYSPWMTADLDNILRSRDCDTLIVTGGETDVCVLSTVLGAVDRGYRVIVVADALFSSSDATHDAGLRLYSERYAEHVETVTSDLILSTWLQ